MKTRLAALLICLALVVSGCGRLIAEDETSSVCATFYPIYALCALTLDGVDGINTVCLTQPQDDCLRSYELSDWDLYVLTYSANTIVYGGRGLESFESTLYSMGDTGPALISAMYDLTLYKDSDTSAATEDSGHLVGANPYLYMSVSGARKMVGNIAAGLAELYPDKSDAIKKAGERAISRLDALYAETQEICAAVAGGKVALMNEALIYPALEYGLSVAYWCDRESGTTYFGEKLDEVISEIIASGAEVVLIEKQAPASLISALESAGLKVVKIDTITGYTAADGADGYINAQLSNARAIAEAFGE